MTRYHEKLAKIMELGLQISLVKDIDVLLEKILSEARCIANADAGSIYLRERDHLKFSYTQNDTLQAKLDPGRKLVYSTFSVVIDHTSIAGYAAESGMILNIPNVYDLPASVPYTFNKSYDAVSGYRTQSVLTIPLVTSRHDVVGVLQLINARNGTGKIVPFPASDEPLFLHFANNAAAAIEKAKMTRGVILRMNKMAEMRDPKETGPHVNRVASYATIIYEAWAVAKGIGHEEIERRRDTLRMAAMLHDVGKVAIPDSILKKPARFTPEEFEEMKKHTLYGARLFGEQLSDFDEAAADVALNHHERWDGKGYPGHVSIIDGTPLAGHTDDNGQPVGKKGEEIPLFGRIVAIADVFDALSSRRCYKEAWDETAVLETMRQESGAQFDPELLEAFFASLDSICHVSTLYPDETG